ncbi:MAG: RagB/SusD family nutrient uptake outer membrane protein [Bacteroidales bacterium]|nr:RagB/SusD family nutrient uptake outer membrane protein [Bacteroidales bacterium]
MKKILLVISMGCALALSACTDMTEKVYSDLTSISYHYSSDDVRRVLGACYLPMKSYIGQEQLWALDQVTADEITMPPNSTGWDNGGVFRTLQYHSWNSEHKFLNSVWNVTWNGIGLCNNVIEQLQKNELNLDEKTNASTLAEVRALRAFYYSIIVDFWGDAPLVPELTQDLPTVTPRSEIYNFVVNELKEAIPNLSEVQGGERYGLFNKWAATTLLAKMYLNAEVYIGKANWQGALDACNSVINSGKFALSENYKDNFRDDDAFLMANKEIIYTIPFDSGNGGYSMYYFSWGSPLKDKFKTGGTPWGSGCAMGVPQFIDTYDEDDIRLDDTWLHGVQCVYGTDTPIKCIFDAIDGVFPDLNYVNDIQSGNFTKEWEGYRMNKFEVPVGCNSMGADYPIFRYSEVLLMKAECLLRLGQPGAGEIVTQVRQRAFKNNPDKAKVTDEQLKGNSAYEYYYYAGDYAFSHPENRKYGPHDKDNVQFGRLYDEYGWELAWELGARTRAIRFGTFKRSWLSHDADASDITTVFPIPQAAITANPNLTQNPNYK